MHCLTVRLLEGPRRGTPTSHALCYRYTNLHINDHTEADVSPTSPGIGFRLLKI